jgi:hypothetical protein
MEAMRILFAILVSVWASASYAADLKRLLQAAVADPNDAAAFAELTAALPRIKLPSDSEVYVLEGDLLFSKEQLRDHLRKLRQEREPSRDGGSNPELKVNVKSDGNRDYYDSQSSRRLTYAIDRKSFSATEYVRVQDGMRQATRQWMAICPTCNITFEYLKKFDSAPSTASTTFVVSRIAQGKFLAASFFPSDPPDRRYLMIDQSYFDQEAFDAVGILRHEIGHILGYRHEHLDQLSGCEFKPEGGSWQSLTDYDPKSVMHYFCNGGGTKKLDFTQRDIRGHRCQYDNSFALSNPDKCDPQKAADNSRQNLQSVAERLEGKAAAKALNTMLPPAYMDRALTLSVRFRGGDIPANLIRVVELLIARKMIEPVEYKVQAGDHICLIYRQIMDWPSLLKCPMDLQRLAARLNNRTSISRIQPGDLIKVVPPLSIRSYEDDKFACGTVCDGRNEPLKPFRHEVADSDKNFDSFLFYELKVPNPDQQLMQSVYDAIAAWRDPLIAVEIVEIAKGKPVRPKFDEEPPEQKTDASSFFFKCATKQLTPSHRVHYLDMIQPGADVPACVHKCGPAGCPDIVMLDGEIKPHFNLRGAIKDPVLQFRDPLATYSVSAAGPPAARDPGEAARDLCAAITDSSNQRKYHATMMAGIIGARTAFPFVGVAPTSQIVAVDVDELSQGDVAERISAWSRRPGWPIIVSATHFPWSEGARPPAQALTKFDAPPVNQKLIEVARLVITAAGQLKDETLFSKASMPDGVELTSKLNAAPANLGYRHNVVVVTACTDCSDEGAKLLDTAFWSKSGMIHLAAPGRNVPALGDDQRLIPDSGGTSTATAFVAGIAASMKNCYSEAYDQPSKIKSRLQLTARPVLTGEDNKRVTGGIVDAGLALKDPSQSYYKKTTSKSHTPVSSFAWCAKTLDISDNDGVQRTKEILRLRRQKSGQFVAFRRPLPAAGEDPEHQKGKIVHSEPGFIDAGLNLAKIDGETVSIDDIDDLILADATSKEVSCQK